MAASKLRRATTLALAWIGAVALFVAGTPREGAAVAILDFELDVFVAQNVASRYRPNTGNDERYFFGTVLRVELPTDVSGNLIDGTARILDFFVPGPIDEIGIYFRFVNPVPSEITGGTFTAALGSLVFPSVVLNFERGTSFANREAGTLDFALTTETVNMTSCAQSGGILTGERINSVQLQTTGTSRLGLVSGQCPYNTTTTNYDEPFGLFLFGTVPEPATGVLLAMGLGVLGVQGRSRRLR